MPQPEKRQGRPPSKYKPDLMEEILDKVSMGGTLTEICKAPGMPKSGTVHAWVRNEPGLRERWMTALELKSHHLIDEALDLSRSLQPMTMRGELMDVSIARTRAVDIRIKALMDMAGRLNPKAYGPRQQISNVVPIQIVTNMNLGQDGVPAIEAGENFYEVSVPIKGLLGGNSTHD